MSLSIILSLYLSLPLSLCLCTAFRATCLTRKLGDALKTFENRRQSLGRECNLALSQSRIEPQKCQSETNEPATVSSVCTTEATTAFAARRRRSRTSQFHTCKLAKVSTGAKTVIRRVSQASH